jgi:hypothetical protein
VAKARPAEAPEEWEAKWVVSQVLSGVPTRRDPPGHDYDIKVGSRRIGLEVTKSAPAERNALNAAIHRLHQREQELISRHGQVAIPDARPGFRGPSLQAIFDNAPAGRLGRDSVELPEPPAPPTALHLTKRDTDFSPGPASGKENRVVTVARTRERQATSPG